MKEKSETKLLVNKTPIELTEFPGEFLAKTVVGAVSVLKGAEVIQSLELYLEQGKVRVIVNGNELALSPFPNDIIASTLTGLVSSLKGVDRIESLEVSIKAL